MLGDLPVGCLDPEQACSLWASEAVGQEAIVAHAGQYAPTITDAQRTGDVVSAGSGTVYRFPTQFVADGDAYEGQVEITLDGELASRVEFVGVGLIG